MMSISILLPVYNDELNIARSTESLLRQTKRDIQLVVIDDGSTDQTPKILASFADERLKVIRAQHAGICGALNLGVTHCSGEYIARMDSDDISDVTRLERQYEFLETHRDHVLVGSWCNVVREDGTVVNRFRPPVTDAGIRKAMPWYNPIVHSSVLMRAETLRLTGGFSVALTRVGHDYDLWWKFLARGSAANLSEPLVTRTHRSNSEFRLPRSQHHKASIRVLLGALQRGDAPPSAARALPFHLAKLLLSPVVDKCETARSRRSARPRPCAVPRGE